MSKTTPLKSDSGLFLAIVFIIIIIIVASMRTIGNWISDAFAKTDTPTLTSTPSATFTNTATNTNTPSPTPTAQLPTPIVVATSANPALDVYYYTSEISCIGNGDVDYSIIDITISGGIKPYEFKIQNMDNYVLGPFPIQKEGEPIRLKLYGGESSWVEIWSGNNKEPGWKGFITSPDKDPSCIPTPTPVPAYSDTPRPTKTRIPSSTPSITLSPSNTPSITISPSNIPGTAKTNTPGTGPSNTPIIVPSNTKVINPSNTPIIVPSNTPIIPSNTPRPTVTPIPTITPIPTPTPFNPNPKECEDGIDNDGDLLIDYPNDPQCDRPGDPHENK